jgi:hypothetical protein
MNAKMMLDSLNEFYSYLEKEDSLDFDFSSYYHLLQYGRLNSQHPLFQYRSLFDSYNPFALTTQVKQISYDLKQILTFSKKIFQTEKDMLSDIEPLLGHNFTSDTKTDFVIPTDQELIWLKLVLTGNNFHQMATIAQELSENPSFYFDLGKSFSSLQEPPTQNNFAAKITPDFLIKEKNETSLSNFYISSSPEKSSQIKESKTQNEALNKKNLNKIHMLKQENEQLKSSLQTQKVKHTSEISKQLSVTA